MVNRSRVGAKVAMGTVIPAAIRHAAILPHSFYDRPTVAVAKDLLGKTLVFEGYQAIISETEAYVGQDDPACHAARGRTKRTQVMFGPAGFSYVYFIYGMYHCLNVVTEAEGLPAAVLIRGVRLVAPLQERIDGPGKLCRKLGITLSHNRLDLTGNDAFCVRDTPTISNFDCTPRIGISKGQDKLWRFVLRAG